MSQLQNKRPDKQKPRTTREVMDRSFKEAFGIAEEDKSKDKKKRKKGTFDQLVEDIKDGKPLNESISEGLQKLMDKDEPAR